MEEPGSGCLALLRDHEEGQGPDPGPKEECIVISLVSQQFEDTQTELPYLSSIPTQEPPADQQAGSSYQ